MFFFPVEKVAPEQTAGGGDAGGEGGVFREIKQGELRG